MQRERELSAAINRKLSKTGLHEGRHSLDFQNPLVTLSRAVAAGLTVPAGFKLAEVIMDKAAMHYLQTHFPPEFFNSPQFFMQGLSFVLGINTLFYLVDPFEIRADKFAEIIYKNPKLQSLVTIQPKAVEKKIP